MMLALSLWLLSDEENEAATNAFWEGLKLIFKIRSSEPLAPVARALVILEPLLSGLRCCALRSNHAGQIRTHSLGLHSQFSKRLEVKS
jgi:hypothetical protein